jgi:very-short-patch-repair endonuclease
MDLTAFTPLLAHQCGVVSRRQLLDGGAGDGDIRRWERNRRLRRVLQGVYVDHTGPLSWQQRAWAAVQYYWPAALSHHSCLDRDGRTLHVAVDATRSPRPAPGVRLHRVTGFDDRVMWNLAPPRLRIEDATLAACSEYDDRVRALALVLDVCRRRLTTPARLSAELDRRPRTRHRAWLRQVLHEAAEGIQSMLESTYRQRVERAHGLPCSNRQHRTRTEDGIVYRDATYDAQRLVVELDGRLGHELSHDRWDDQDRDLLVAVEGVMTLRLGWRHCETTPCRTAARLGRVLQSRGWSGRLRPCGPGCSGDMTMLRIGHGVTNSQQ